MRRSLTIPNLLSGLRLLLVPVLWVCAGLHLPQYIGLGLLASFLILWLCSEVHEDLGSLLRLNRTRARRTAS